MPFRLRDYQQRAIDKLRKAFLRHRSVVLQLPTGAGKTAVAGAFAEDAALKGQELLALVHRRELVDQFCETLDGVGLRGHYGIIAAGRTPSPWAKMQVASIQTLHRRPGLDLDPHYVVIDECHHARAKTWSDVLDRFPNAKVLGMTATPIRLDGKPLGRHFKHLVSGPSILELVENGWLAPTSMRYVDRGILTQGVKQTAGDYNRGELGARLSRKVVAAPVEAFLRYAADRRAIFFGINTHDSYRVAERFAQCGISAAHVDGETPPGDRDWIIESFRAGRIQVLCNVDIVSEGTDVPQCDCVMMGLPTLSLTRYMQQAGRAMRPDHRHDALILDLVGNIWRHGRPDLPRTWTLHGTEPTTRQPREQSASTRKCVDCGTAIRSRGQVCQICGAVQPIKLPAHVNAELLPDPVNPIVANLQNRRFLELRDQIEPNWGWPATFSCNWKREVWPVTRSGFTPVGEREHLEGVFPALDEIVRHVLDAQRRGGRFRIGDDGVFLASDGREVLRLDLPS